MRISFDRGTLLIGAPHNAGLERWPDVRWDARIRGYRAPAFRYRDILLRLRAEARAYRNDVPARGWVAREWKLVPLRSHQHSALLAWMQDQRGLLVLPPGSGKARIACAAMAACGAATLCLAPSATLAQRWRAEIAQRYRGPVGCLGAGEEALEAITVAAFEAANRHMHRIGNRFGMLIIDDVHGSSDARDRALAMCTAPRRLGLSATAPESAPGTPDAIGTMIGPLACQVQLAELARQWLPDFEVNALEFCRRAGQRQGVIVG